MYISTRTRTHTPPNVYNYNIHPFCVQPVAAGCITCWEWNVAVPLMHTNTTTPPTQSHMVVESAPCSLEQEFVICSGCR